MRSCRSLLLVLAVILAPGLGLAQDHFFDSDGARLRYIDRGEGKPIIFLHGNTVSLEAWIDSGVLPSLENDYRVIAFDARGHGKSDKPRTREEYGAEMGLDAVRLLDHLAVAKAHFIGYSMGASIVAQLLTTHPDRFITATLGGSPGRFNWTDADTARSELEAAEKEARCISKSQIARARPADVPELSQEELDQRSERCMATQDRLALAAFHRSRQDQAISPDDAAAVKVPTLGIVGSRDGYLKGFQELVKIRPELELVIVEGASHGGSESAHRRPEFVEAVREFISEPR